MGGGAFYGTSLLVIGVWGRQGCLIRTEGKRGSRTQSNGITGK